MSTNASNASIALPLVFIIVALSLLLCSCFCFGILCCLAPLIKLGTILILSICACFKVSSTIDSRGNGGLYQKTNRSSYYSQGYQSDEAATTPLNEVDIVVTDAYFTSPLVAAHVIKEDEQTLMSTEESIESQQSDNSVQFKDFWFTLIFILNVIIITSLSICEGMAIYKTNDVNSNKIEKEIIDISARAEPLIVSVLVLGALATLFASLWLNFLMNNSEHIIKFAMIFNILASAVSAVVFFLYGNLIFGVLLLLCTIGNYYYYNSVQNRIPFATAVLSTAIKAIKQNLFGLLSTAYCLILVQVLYLVIWGISIIGVASYFETAYKTSNENDEHTKKFLQSLSYFTLILSLYWTLEIIKNILLVTTAGTVATWFFQPERAAPVRSSLFRSLTTSFGSICFGSLLVAIIQTLRDSIHLIRNNVNNSSRNRNMLQVVFLCILDQLISWLEAAVRYFNRYSMIYVAAWGKSYLKSGYEVMNLFEKRGWTALIQDNLISNCLSLSIVSISVFSALMGYIFAYFCSNTMKNCGIENPEVFLAMIGGVIGAGVGQVIVSLLHAGVATIFVCSCEDLKALEKNHPVEYELLVYRWQLIYPGSLNINVNTYTPQHAEQVASPLTYANKV